MTERMRETWGYVAGLVLAAILTGASFAAIYWPAFGRRTFAIVCVIGLVQVIVQFRFFLHVRFKGSARDDLLLLLFSSLIVALMAGGTLVLMANLRGRMM